jgi:tetratricopeptide (TPR) repeat protein
MRFIFFTLMLFLFLPGSVYAEQVAGSDSLEKILLAKKGLDRFDILCELSRMNDRSNPLKSMKYAEEAFILAKESNDPELLSQALNSLAIVFYYLGDQSKSMDYLVRSIDPLENMLKNDSGNARLLYRLASSLNSAGNVYRGFGDAGKSLDYMMRALKYEQALLDINSTDKRYIILHINSINNMGMLYFELGKLEKAKAMFNDGLKKSKDIYPGGTAMNLNSLGMLYIDLKEYRKAEKLFLEALKIDRQLEDSIAIGDILNNLGKVNQNLKNLKTALLYYKSSLMISQGLGYLYGMANASNNLGKIFIVMGNPDSAFFYLNKGLVLAKSGDMVRLVMENYHARYDFYKSTDNWSMALKSYQEYITLKDSIMNAEKTRQIADIEARYETEKRGKEDLLLEKNLELERATRRFLLVTLIALIFIVILLLILIRYKNRLLFRKKLLIEQEQVMRTMEHEKCEAEEAMKEERKSSGQRIQDLRQRNLAFQTFQAARTRKLLESILHEIDMPGMENKADRTLNLNHIRELIHFSTIHDYDWEPFRLRFDEIHPDFFTRLNEQFPGLSPGEKKICTYFRIHLGISEIAEILQVTVASVQKKCQSLRKKMNIPAGMEMADFMLRF